jgi:hypothetical protein
MIGANRPDEVHTLRAADAGHVRAKRLGDLHGECAHTARGAVDQDLLPGLDQAFVAKPLQGGQPGHWR